MVTYKNIGLLAGLFFFITIILFPTPESMPVTAKHVLAVAVLMASWWVSTAIPIAATSLLPIFLFPALGIMDGTEVTKPYAHHLIYLFLGGFLIAVTIEKWNLHRRIALYTIKVIGITPDRIILGFMLASAGLSMWISNTATTMMMITIGLAVLKKIIVKIEQDPNLHIDTRPENFHFGISLLLGIAYASSIGGVATLIGTAPNAIFAGIVENNFGERISFLDWMVFAIPLSLCMLIITWFYLTRFAFPHRIDYIPGGTESIEKELHDLGSMSRQEKSVLFVFLLVALLWTTHSFIKIDAFKYITDSTISMAGALLLFIIPSDFKKREFLLDWKTASKIPWDILILFGGGFALAQGFTDSGLTQTIANQFNVLQGSDLLLIILAIVTVVIILTEVTSNTATASMFLPVIAALAIAMTVHPYSLMISVTLAASFAFMLPVATPPNAIAFSSHFFTIAQMAKTGIWLNLIGIILISLFVKFYLPIIWNIDINALPITMAVQISNP
jgi:sodium-dependent dicarboxylate transporter 2/3/5